MATLTQVPIYDEQGRQNGWAWVSDSALSEDQRKAVTAYLARLFGITLQGEG